MPTFLVTIQHQAGQLPERYLRNGVDICDAVAEAAVTWPQAASQHVRLASHTELSLDCVLAVPLQHGDAWLQLLPGHVLQEAA